jgi:hypothetical protein
VSSHADTGTVDQATGGGVRENAVDESNDMVRPPDQLQIGGETAVVAEVVTRVLDRSSDEAGAGEGREAVMVAHQRAAGAVRENDQGKRASGGGGIGHGIEGEGAQLGRRALRLRRIDDDGRHWAAFDGVGEGQVQEARAMAVGVHGAAVYNGAHDKAYQEHAAHAA